MVHSNQSDNDKESNTSADEEQAMVKHAKSKEVATADVEEQVSDKIAVSNTADGSHSRPGAVYMRGSQVDLVAENYASSDNLKDPTVPESTTKLEGPLPELPALGPRAKTVEAYLVPSEDGQDAERAKFRQSDTPTTVNTSSAVNNDHSQPLVEATLDRRSFYLSAGAVLVLMLVGLSIAFMVTRVNKSSSDADEEEGLRVTFLYNSKRDGTFIEGRQFSTVEDGKPVLTTRGNAVEIDCVVGPCKDNPGSCLVTTDAYEEGCCFGEECSEETKCGENCPSGACNPGFEGCISPECYTCERGTVNGGPEQEIYRMRDTTGDIICADYGTFTTKEGGSYDWVVYCVKIIHGGHEESNFAPGEYYCQALRQGDPVQNLTLSHTVPCQYIQLGECGCGPADMHPFGLDPPTKPCETAKDCKFLCSDAPMADPQDLCNAFGIGWWEGDNFLGVDTFMDPWQLSQPEFEIIIFAEE